jgi:hypothetical protein
MEQRLKLLGILSVGAGLLAAGLCVFGFQLFLLALMVGFIGMLISTVYIFLDVRNEINTKKFTAGVLGLILSSFPVLMLMIIIVIRKINE